MYDRAWRTSLLSVSLPSVRMAYNRLRTHPEVRYKRLVAFSKQKFLRDRIEADLIKIQLHKKDLDAYKAHAMYVSE